MHILVVDDEKEIADLVELYLTNDGYQVTKFYNGLDALAFVEKTQPDLALLDVMLPDISGFTLCQKIRENYVFPIIMLTARVEDMDKVTGLSIGADDYITKPFQPVEMMARVKAQLRRVTRYNAVYQQNASVADLGALVINQETHQCFLYDKELTLTPTEFKILWVLAQNQGNVVSSETLFEQVWGEKYFDSNNTVMVHIRRLREKLEEKPGQPKWVKTVWGVGYKLESPAGKTNMGDRHEKNSNSQ